MIYWARYFALPIVALEPREVQCRSMPKRRYLGDMRRAKVILQPPLPPTHTPGPRRVAV